MMSTPLVYPLECFMERYVGERARLPNDAPPGDDAAARFDLQQCGLGKPDGVGQAGDGITRSEVPGHPHLRDAAASAARRRRWR